MIDNLVLVIKISLKASFNCSLLLKVKDYALLFCFLRMLN